MKPVLLVTSMLWACATAGPVNALTPGGIFGARDYLRTARDTLHAAETDADGHRVRAERETQAALDALGEVAAPARKVPFTGPPTLAIALDLLEHGEIELSRMSSQNALVHTRRAADELRAAIASREPMGVFWERSSDAAITASLVTGSLAHHADVPDVRERRCR